MKSCACGGILQRYTSKDGGCLVPYLVTDERGYLMKDNSSIELRRVGTMLACNKCEHCERV